MRQTNPTRAEALLDREIEREYYRIASGVQVDVMDIGKIFKEAREAYAQGQPVAASLPGIVAKYRQN